MEGTIAETTQTITKMLTLGLNTMLYIMTWPNHKYMHDISLASKPILIRSEMLLPMKWRVLIFRSMETPFEYVTFFFFFYGNVFRPRNALFRAHRKPNQPYFMSPPYLHPGSISSKNKPAARHSGNGEN